MIMKTENSYYVVNRDGEIIAGPFKTWYWADKIQREQLKEEE